MSNCTDCDYCGEIAMVYSDGFGGKACYSCLADIEDAERTEEMERDELIAEEYEIEADRILEQQELEDFEQVDEYFGHYGEEY